MENKKRKINYLFYIAYFVIFNSLLFSQTPAGPFNPGTVTTGSCSFSYSSLLGYAPANNVMTSNNVNASVVHCGCCDANTNCLTATNFGFAIPGGAIITGITVEIEKRSSAGSIVEDNGLRLLKAGVEVGSNLANFGIAWPSADAYSTYGGCNNMWGTTWTPADINAANFGLVFASIDYSCAGNVNSFIDHVRVTVCYNLALPLQLLSFMASRNDNDVKLNWETEAELNCDYFVIQKSETANEFTDAGIINSKDQRGSSNSYSFTDLEAGFATQYYRLKMVDLDKTFMYSNIISANSGTRNHNIVIYPNPTEDKVYIEANDKSLNGLKIVLVNILGIIIELEKYNISENNGKHILDISYLNDGIYFLQIHDASDNSLIKRQLLVKQDKD